MLYCYLTYKFLLSDRDTKTQPAPVQDYHIINKLMRMLPNGKEAKDQVDQAIQKLGNVYHLGKAMSKAVARYENARDDEHQLVGQSDAMMAVSRYFKLIEFQDFVLGSHVRVSFCTLPCT